MEEKCENCRFWRQREKYADTGYCRRYPPQMTLNEGGHRWDTVPRTDVAPDDWCGESAAKRANSN